MSNTKIRKLTINNNTNCIKSHKKVKQDNEVESQLNSNIYKKTPFTDACIKVGDFEFHMSKQQICNGSKEFTKHFTDKDTVSINENPKNVKLFLDTFIPFEQKLISDIESWIEIYKIAYKYKVGHVIKKCKETFIKNIYWEITEEQCNIIWDMVKNDKVLSNTIIKRMMNSNYMLKYDKLNNIDFLRKILAESEKMRTLLSLTKDKEHLYDGELIYC